MSLGDNLNRIRKEIEGFECKLIAVSKTYPPETILEAYNLGHKIFGENKVQELTSKHEQLPKDIEWHLIGHLQTNKVKYIAPFVHLVHSVDSLKLLQEINKQAEKNHRVIPCLLQIFIATEETKFGLSFEEAEALLASPETGALKNVRITGLMGMSTHTDNCDLVRMEFRSLKTFFEKLKKTPFPSSNIEIKELSMGMSGDYLIALEEGSTMIRVGSAIFGKRDYSLQQ